VLVQDRCMVCAKPTIGSEMVSDAPDGTPGDEAQVEARFGSFVDNANLDAGRTIGSEIILDAPNGSPR
jgi:hypothetical protein